MPLPRLFFSDRCMETTYETVYFSKMTFMLEMSIPYIPAELDWRWRGLWAETTLRSPRPNGAIQAGSKPVTRQACTGISPDSASSLFFPVTEW